MPITLRMVFWKRGGTIQRTWKRYPVCQERISQSLIDIKIPAIISLRIIRIQPPLMPSKVGGIYKPNYNWVGKYHLPYMIKRCQENKRCNSWEVCGSILLLTAAVLIYKNRK